jgi:hypothetical protein
MKSLVNFSADGAILNEKRINILKKLAGRFLIVTNTDLPEREVVSAYKEQWEIERSFRTIKSFIEIRPVYHRKSERIKAHVFICVLSLLLSRIIEKKTELIISETVRILWQLKVTPIRLKSGIIMIRSESEQILNLLNRMNIPYPEKIIDGARKKEHKFCRKDSKIALKHAFSKNKTAELKFEYTPLIRAIVEIFP